MEKQDPQRARALVHFYARQGWYGHVQNVCEAGLRRKSNDTTLLFWKGWALAMQGAHNEAIQELNAVKHKRDVEYASTAALIMAHERCKVVDYAALDGLKDSLGQVERGATDAAQLLAAQFQLYSGELNEALRVVESLLPRRGTADTEKTPVQLRAELLRAWCGLRLHATAVAQGDPRRGENELEHAAACFGDQRRAQEARARGESNQSPLQAQEPDVLLGRAMMHEAQGHYTLACDALSLAVVTHPWFAPALTEKARVLMFAGDWEQGYEDATRALSTDATNVSAMRLRALHALCHSSDIDNTARELGSLLGAVDRIEPKCPQLYYDMALPFARLARADPQLLQQTLAMAERAMDGDATNASFAAEVGTQLLMLGDVAEATAAFRRASRVDESSVQALHGLVRSQLFGGGAETRSTLADAEQQLEFLSVIQEGDDGDTNAEFTFLQAVLTWRKDGDMTRALQQLRRAAQLHRDRAERGAARGSGQYGAHDPALKLAAADPNFTMELVREHVQHLGGEPLERMTLAEGEPLGECLRAAQRLLRELAELAPAHREAKLTLATVQYVAGEIDAASALAVELLRREPSYAAAHLLVARIALKRERWQAADQALEQATSVDFSVRRSALFHLLKARVLQANNKLSAALEVLKEGLALPGVRVKAARSGRDSKAADTSDSVVPVSRSDRCALLLEAAELFFQLNDLSSAVKLIGEAKQAFRGSGAEAGRVAIAEARAQCRRNNFRAAIAKLSSVPVESPVHAVATREKAEVYLVHRRDRRLFIRCFEEMAEPPESESRSRGDGARACAYVALGDAHLRVQQPERAITAFQQALALQERCRTNAGESSSAQLAAKIGQVMVSMHDFEAAIEYYERSLLSASDDEARSVLQHGLAALYSKLQRHSDAARVLTQALEKVLDSEEGKDSDAGGRRKKGLTATELTSAAQNLILLADVHCDRAINNRSLRDAEVQRANEEELSALVQAKRCVKQALARMHSESGVEQQEQRALLARVCARSAAFYIRLARENNGGRVCVRGSEGTEESVDGMARASQFYVEALEADSSNATHKLEYARLLLDRGDLEGCQHQCVALLRMDLDEGKGGGADEATLMIADVEWRRGEVDQAAFHYRRLLERSAVSFEALSRLVLLLRNSGTLPEAKGFLEEARRVAHTCNEMAGLNYCEGLYHRYRNDVHEAVRAFNLASRDAQWGERALTALVEIYVNPTGDNLWEAVADTDSRNVRAEQVRVAEEMLNKLGRQSRRKNDAAGSSPSKSARTGTSVLSSASSKRYAVLECYILIAMGPSDNNMERAHARCLEVLESPGGAGYVPAMLALANVFMVQKQLPKARNQLKRISKSPYNPEFGDEIEKGNLMLVEHYIEKGKYDIAQQLCNKVLTHNKSSAKAHEQLGLIMEKEASYRDAADNYESAWKHDGEASAAAGFKLAFNYLKAERFVEAIDVCHKVIKMYPNYPRIREEILDKARESLRMA